MKLQLKNSSVGAEARNKPEEKIPMQKMEDGNLIPTQVKLTFHSEWDSFVRAKN